MSRKNRFKMYSVEEIRRTHARAYVPWTKEEDDELRRCAHLPVRALAKKFGRDRGAIRSRLSTLGQTAPGGTPHVQGEAKQPAGLPVVTPIVTPSYVAGPWSREEDATLRRLANLKLGELSTILGRAPDRISARRRILGLTVTGTPLELRSTAVSTTKSLRKLLVAVACATLLVLLGVVMANCGRGWFGRPTGTEAPQSKARRQPMALDAASCLRIATWNVRGYPEIMPADAEWFLHQLIKLQADVLCVQEIANDERVAKFRAHHLQYTHHVFQDSDSALDNGVFATDDVVLDGLDVPVGFRHPPQIAYVARGGFDAVVVTLHLAWEPAEMRRDEMELLEPLVRDLLKIDPDVMLAGDFNLPPGQARALAEGLGMTILLGRNQTAVGTMFSGNSYDYFIVSSDLATEEAQGATVVTFERADLEVARRVSDHMPVLGFFACDERFRDRPANENPNE